MLRDGARDVVANHGGVIPDDVDALMTIAGIGRYTAGAIASIAFGEPVGLVDGNVARVLARVFAIDEDMRKRGMRTAELVADAIVAKRDPGAWNQALMELGATVCTPRSPSCEVCPVAHSCRALRENRVAQLPLLSEKKAPVARRVQAVVALDSKSGSVLLARRRPERLFGGLWEPPSIEGSARMRRTLAAWLPVGKLVRAGAVEHVLSHRKLTIDVLRGELTGELEMKDVPESAGYDAVRVLPVAEIGELGISTLTRKILGVTGA
jgi:A/G-specific adenine glycosylase